MKFHSNKYKCIHSVTATIFPENTTFNSSAFIPNDLFPIEGTGLQKASELNAIKSDFAALEAFM